MELRVRDEVVAGTTVVVLDGLVDLASIPVLQDHLVRIIRANPGATVAVDLDAVVGLDDCGLGLLLGGAARARDAGGDLVVVCSAERLRARFRTTRLDQAIEIRSHLGETPGCAGGEPG